MTGPTFKFTKKDFSFLTSNTHTATVEFDVRTLYIQEEIDYYLAIIGGMDRVVVIVNRTWVSVEIANPEEVDVINCIAAAIIARKDYSRNQVVDMRLDFISTDESPVVCRLWIKLGAPSNE